MPFVHRHDPTAKPCAADSCLVVQGDRLLARTDTAGAFSLPDHTALNGWAATNVAPLHLGSLKGQIHWAYSVSDDAVAAPAGWEWVETRALLATFTPAELQAVSCARQLLWWDSRHRFCGRCGTPTVDSTEERAKRCPHCHAVFFPVTSPAVIVAVTRGDQLLLAHNRNFRPGLFSLLAGFVDPGETLEHAAIREVFEETGVVIGDPRYLTSQPWAFPNSLMVGFRATWVRGELSVDGKEIEHAGWYARTALPEIPGPGTVARLLIDEWLAE